MNFRPSNVFCPCCYEETDVLKDDGRDPDTLQAMTSPP